MSSDNSWISSFAKHAKELVKFHTFGSILNEERHRESKEMVVQSMFGKFECNNPKCKKKNYKGQGKRSWTSTQCSTLISYRYNSRMKRGEIEIDKEYQQACKFCNTDALSRWEYIVGYLPDIWKFGLFPTFNAAKIVLISYLDNIFGLQSHTKSHQSKKSIFTLMGSHIDNSENSIIMSFNDKKIIY